MNENIRYCFLQDSDGHWYLCPADMRAEAVKTLNASSEYWRPGSDYSGDPPEVPSEVQMLGTGPEAYSFEKPRLRGYK